MGLELLLGSFYLCFLGLGFALSALLEWWLGFENYGNVYVLCALSVGVFSLLGLVFLRKPLSRLMRGSSGFDDDFLNAQGVGEVREGMVYFKGTLWHCENLGALGYKDGDKVQVKGTRGNAVELDSAR